MTSVVQPMDQGVIRNLKHFYWGLVVQKILSGIDTEEMVKIDLLDACRMIQNAWQKVTCDTVANCSGKPDLYINAMNLNRSKTARTSHLLLSTGKMWATIYHTRLLYPSMTVWLFMGSLRMKTSWLKYATRRPKMHPQTKKKKTNLNFLKPLCQHQLRRSFTPES